MQRLAITAIAAVFAILAPARAEEAPELRGRLSASVVNLQSAGGGSAQPVRSLRQRTIRIIEIDRRRADAPMAVLLPEIQSGR